MVLRINKLLPFYIILLLFLHCVAVEKAGIHDESISSDITRTDNQQVLGFGILSRIPGLWNGPVFSDTPAGSFDNWYVDFRPVSPGQVSQYSTLDAQTLNFISFFIVKHDDKLKVALRTEGVFQNKGCVTYEVIDKVDEARGYYRFSDFKAGTERAYTEFTFKDDGLIMEVYTNKFNRLNKLQLHSRWEAKLADRKAAEQAINHFNFPQPVMIKDFSDVFRNMSESIYFTFENDPYSSLRQPYVGTVNVNIIIDKNLKVKDDDELFLLLTTESLFQGLLYKEENLKYISKYVYLPIETRTFTITNVHPGTYYLYSYNDVNGDKRHLSGDYMSSDLNNVFTLETNGNITVDTKIDFVIP